MSYTSLQPCRLFSHTHNLSSFLLPPASLSLKLSPSLFCGRKRTSCISGRLFITGKVQLDLSVRFARFAIFSYVFSLIYNVYILYVLVSLLFYIQSYIYTFASHNILNISTTTGQLSAAYLGPNVFYPRSLQLVIAALTPLYLFLSLSLSLSQLVLRVPMARGATSVKTRMLGWLSARTSPSRKWNFQFPRARRGCEP